MQERCQRFWDQCKIDAALYSEQCYGYDVKATLPKFEAFVR